MSDTHRIRVLRVIERMTERRGPSKWALAEELGMAAATRYLCLGDLLDDFKAEGLVEEDAEGRLLLAESCRSTLRNCL